MQLPISPPYQDSEPVLYPFLFAASTAVSLAIAAVPCPPMCLLSLLLDLLLVCHLQAIASSTVKLTLTVVHRDSAASGRGLPALVSAVAVAAASDLYSEPDSAVLYVPASTPVIKKHQAQFLNSPSHA